MIWRLGASAEISQSASAESRGARQIGKTVSVQSPGPEANRQSMRQLASDQSVLVAFAEGTHRNRPTLSDQFPHAGPTCGWLAERFLHGRLALSRAKHEVRRLARGGQVVEKASDLTKDLVYACKNEVVVERTLPEDANIYASKYQLCLPSRHELAEQLAIG